MAQNKNRIKVLQVVNGMNHGGIQSFVMNLYRGIDKEWFDFVFLTYTPGVNYYQKEIEAMGGKFVKIISGHSGNRLEHFRQLNRVIKQEKPDVVHCHTYYDAAWVMLIAKHNKVPIRITHSHTTHGLYLKHKMIHRVLAAMIRRNSNVMLACGKEAGMVLFGKPCFKIINNGIDLEKFKYSKATRQEIRKKLKIDDSTVVIGHVGRFSKEKNQEYLIDILEQLVKSHNEYKVLFLGDGELRKDIQEKVKKAGLTECFVFLGSIENTSDYYNAFDVFVFPSIYEGFPVTLVEAQANGLPVVASASIDASSKINSNVYRLSLDSGPQKWAETINKLSFKHTAPSEKLSQFSVTETVSKMEKIYLSGKEERK